jgi:hypothetical protein
MNESLSPQQAAQLLSETSRYEDRLVQRTEGLTAILWGLVTPAIWTTYGFADVLGHGIAPWVASLLWLPWVTAGAVATFALWRSAALTRPDLDRERGWQHFVRWLGLVVVLALVFWFVRPTDPASPLIVVGAAWFAMAAFNVWGSSRRGRRIWGGCGLALALTGTALILAGASDAVAGMTSILVSGLVPFGAGLWQTLQG